MALRDIQTLIQSFARVSDLIASGHELNSTLDQIVEVLAGGTQAERCSLMLREGPDTLRLRAGRGLDPAYRNALRRIGEGVAGGVARTGEARLLRDVRRETGSVSGASYSGLSAICVPMRLRDELVGVVNLSNKAVTGEFDEDDLGFATALANHAALAIHTAREREAAHEQEQLRASMSLLEAQVDALQYSEASLAVIRQVTDAMVSSGSLKEVLNAIVRETAALLGATRGSLMLIDPPTQVMHMHAVVGIDEEVVSRARTELGEGIAGRCAERGEAMLLSGDRSTVDSLSPSSQYRSSSAICVPLKIKGQVLGVLNINDRKDEQEFTENDLFIAQLIANQASVAITNSRLLAESVDAAAARRSLEVAREIQQSFVPADPGVAGYEIAGRSDPCDETGGDYIDFAPRRDAHGHATGQLFVAIGDVSGHGVGAALIMATSRAFLRALLTQRSDLADVFLRLNNLVIRDVRKGGFMTLFVAIADPDRGELTYASAGHDPALLMNAQGIRELTATGPPLGVLADVEFPTATVSFAPGDQLLLTTDGVWEVQRPDGKAFGRESLAGCLEELASCTPSATIEGVRDRVLAFAEGRERRDDFSLVALRAVSK